ncbi:MAG: HIT family protein [Patescibacteria group bacterium]
MDSACVFCDRKNLEERLIYENDDFYVAATLGQITDGGYILIIPKRHVVCLTELTSHIPNSETGRLTSLSLEVNTILKAEYKKIKGFYSYTDITTMFEHGIVGQTVKHAHLHMLPDLKDFSRRIKKDFPQSEIQELKYAEHIQKLYKDNPRPYLFWTNVIGKGTVCWNPPAPAQYLRLIAAELLGRPERGNWKNMDPELDKRLSEETVRRLKPYFQ